MQIIPRTLDEMDTKLVILVIIQLWMQIWLDLKIDFGHGLAYRSMQNQMYFTFQKYFNHEGIQDRGAG